MVTLHAKEHLDFNGEDLGDSQCVQADALDNGWKPHPERNNQTTGNESWSRSGNVRFKRRQLGGRDGH